MTKTSSKRILILLGHPSGDSFCAALAEAYAESARAQGHAVRELRQNEIATERGFVLHEHALSLYGTCAECTAKKVPPRKAS